MKTPTKAELYAQIDVLQKEVLELRAQLDAQKHKYWLDNTGKAKRVLFDSVPFTVLQINRLTLDHVDSTGYWFSFNVDKDQTRQTYCVRHADLEEELI